MKLKTADAARGKWRGILKALGFPEQYLQNRHMDCPLCQDGKDRYRWDDRDGKGTYFCSQCGNGDGMDLALRWTGKDFKTLAAEIDSMVGNIQVENARPKGDGSKRVQRALEGAEEVMQDDPVWNYLKSRKLPKSSALKINPGLTYYDDGKILGRFAAMLAPMHSPVGDLLTVHVTYLNRDGTKASVPSVKKLLSAGNDGGAIRLTRPYQHIGIAEGVETALAVMKMHRLPCWAAANADLLAKFVPPAGVESLTIWADNDSSFAGQRAAFVLANKLWRSVKVDVRIPERIDTDFADYVT